MPLLPRAGLLARLNIVAIILLQKPAFAVLRDDEAQRAQGLDPVFHPEKLGIKNADYWAGHRAAEGKAPLHDRG